MDKIHGLKIGKIKSALIVAALAFVVLCSYEVIQNIGCIHDFFFPNAYISVEPSDTITTETLTFKSIFWKKEIINHANNEEAVVIKIKDSNYNLLDTEKIEPGTSIKLHGKNRYIIDIMPVTTNIHLYIR